MGNIGNNRDTNMTAQTCWKELPFGFKCMFVGGGILTILQISATISYYFFDNLQFVLYLHQIWRPFVAMLFSSGGFGIFNFLIAFLWLLPILPALEKQQSTIFLLVNIYVKNLVVQFAFLIISFLLRAVTDALIISGGWFITIIIYLFLQSAKNPQQDVRFCWMPCLIKQKYIPWIMLVLIAMFGRDILGCLLGALLGYLEAFVLNGSYLIKLPVFVYTKLDYCVPDFIKQRSDYTKVSSCLANIRQNCCCTDNSASTSNNWQQNHVDNRSVQTNEAKVQVIGGGQALGTSFKQENIDPRSIWLKKAQEMQIQKQKAQINQKFDVNDEIQGVAHSSTNYEDDNDDNSVVNLAGNDQQQKKRSEKDLLE